MTEITSSRKKISRVLILVKETYLEQVEASQDRHQLEEIARKAPGLENVAESHAQHVSTLNAVRDFLIQEGVIVDVVNRRAPNIRELLELCDLVITVGGDGTFLTASHDIITAVPVLGVNSAPVTSFGHFCLCAQSNFPATWEQIKNGQLAAHKLLRLKLTLNGKVLPTLVLNEILVAHNQPAGTSRYQIKKGGQSAAHKCSGLLVATPSGSTGFLRSEGGQVLPITDRRFVFLERAPFLRIGETAELKSGLVGLAKLELVSQMQEGIIYVDGDHIQYPFPRGATLTVEAAEADLLAYIDPEIHTPFIKEGERSRPTSGFWTFLRRSLQHIQHP